MAIKGFKDIEQKKGYRVEKKDREIFEREVRRGVFGIDVGDIIEFIVYDASDNPLPQESANGKTARYVSYTDTNIQKYFSKVNQTKFNIKRNGAEEFFVDIEKLIKMNLVSYKNEQNSKNKIIQLTTVGKSKLREAIIIWEETQHKYIKALGIKNYKEIDTLITKISKINI